MLNRLVMLWLAITPVLVCGWWLARRARFRVAALTLLLFARRRYLAR